jgi:hypothetical protein
MLPPHTCPKLSPLRLTHTIPNTDTATYIQTIGGSFLLKSADDKASNVVPYE